jgi:hypothetical protein
MKLACRQSLHFTSRSEGAVRGCGTTHEKKLYDIPVSSRD